MKISKVSISYCIVLATVFVLTSLLNIDVTHYCYTRHNVWQHFIYPFFHANIWHLLGNILCVALLRNRVFKYDTSFWLCIYAVAVIMSFIAFSKLPVCGFSGEIFCALGLSFSTTRKITLSTIITLTIVGVMSFHIAGLLHLMCFVCGTIIGYLYLKLKLLHNDCRILNR